ncbi:MAG: hypothetical protein VX169_07300 [Pseudomonadota bacterium]|nr:hypothetical protein [Pseudomonadota bacterium]URQ67751.1 hypothetical protein M9C81_05670 [SAR86 cluster bacterium]
MTNLRRLFSQHVIVLSLIIISLGCTSIPMESQKFLPEIKSVQENFKIDGKFKLSYMDSKETGYFVLSKEGNTVSLNIGKNYLLPEKVIILDRRETLNINAFIENNILPYNLPVLKVERFLELLLGLETKDLQDEEIGLELETKSFDDYPSEFTLSYKDINLLLKVKKIWKN